MQPPIGLVQLAPCWALLSLYRSYAWVIALAQCVHASRSVVAASLVLSETLCDRLALPATNWVLRVLKVRTGSDF